jgi:colicin import membrane protein
VNLRLEPGGQVIPGSVKVVQSSGHGAFDQSVISAVYKASPLPVPDGNEFDELFQDFNFRFTP